MKRMKEKIYDFSIYIGWTIIPILAFRYIVLGLGLSIEYDEVREHHYIEYSSLYHFFILGVVALFFIFIWYYGLNYFFPNLYKYKIDKRNKEELERIRIQFREITNYELDQIVWERKRKIGNSLFPVYIDEKKEKYANEAYIEKERRDFEENYEEIKSKSLEFAVLLFIGFSLGYLWVK